MGQTMTEPIEINIYVAVRADRPHSVLIIPSTTGWCLPHRTYEGECAFDDVAAEILSDLGAKRRQALSFTQCVTVGRPSAVAVLFTSNIGYQPFYKGIEVYEWLDPFDFSLPVDALSTHFIMQSMQLNSEPYVDLGSSVPRVKPPVLLPGQQR
jgi:hypothetical protein